MRRVIVSMNVTLDGFMSGPGGELDWHFPLWNEEMSECACRQLSTMDTILLGRVTYQSMAGYWPHAPASCFAGMMNAYTKLVFSTRLQTLSWNNSQVLNGNMIQEVAALKQRPGRNIIVYGSGSIVSALVQCRLVDEFRVWMHPVVIGKGKVFFNGLSGRIKLNLLQTKTFSSGVILLYYQPVMEDRFCCV